MSRNWSNIRSPKRSPKERCCQERRLAGQRVLEIVAADRTGLLSRIADVLSKRDISIETARVNTLGARAEDVFVVSGGRLTEESTRITLETELAEAIA